MFSYFFMKCDMIQKTQKTWMPDRFVLSKGHGNVLKSFFRIIYPFSLSGSLCSMAWSGYFVTWWCYEVAEIWFRFGRYISNWSNGLITTFSGHPTPRLNFIDVATGSLGQGLSVACGMAYNGKYYDKASYRTYCLLGDGECFEGSIWEAAGKFKNSS